MAVLLCPEDHMILRAALQRHVRSLPTLLQDQRIAQLSDLILNYNPRVKLGSVTLVSERFKLVLMPHPRHEGSRLNLKVQLPPEQELTPWFLLERP